MKIKVKYSNGKLLSDNKDIILNNVANIYEIAKNDPNALTTKLFFGIVTDGNGEVRILSVTPVRSLVDNDVIYLYVWDNHTKHWHRLDKFTETRTIFDSHDECVDFYMKNECGVSDEKETGKSIADELLDEVEKKSREDKELKNFEELCEYAKKIEEYRKLTAEIAKVKEELKKAVSDLNVAEDEYNNSLALLKKVTIEHEHNRAVLETVKKVKEQFEKKIEELDNRRAELDIEKEANDYDVSDFWDNFLHRCFTE